LAQRQVTESDIHQMLQDLVRRRGLGLPLGEVLQGLCHRHLEHLGDIASSDPVFEHGRLIAPAVAFLASAGHRRHEPQIRVHDTRPVAGRAGSFGVRAEQGRLHAVHLGEGLANGIQRSGIGGRIRPS